jgi:hypothetical protein
MKKKCFTNKEKGEANEDLHVWKADEVLMIFSSQTQAFYTKVSHLWLDIQSTWCQCYKTFNGRKLRIFYKLKWLAWQAFPTVMFAGKSGAYSRVERLTRKH